MAAAPKKHIKHTSQSENRSFGGVFPTYDSIHVTPPVSLFFSTIDGTFEFSLPAPTDRPSSERPGGMQTRNIIPRTRPIRRGDARCDAIHPPSTEGSILRFPSDRRAHRTGCKTDVVLGSTRRNASPECLPPPPLVCSILFVCNDSNRAPRMN